MWPIIRADEVLYQLPGEVVHAGGVPHLAAIKVL